MSVTEVQVSAVGEDAVIVDVREDNEWAAGHIATAVHIPLGELPARLAELPESQVVHLICRAGGRSLRAANLVVVQTGRDVVSIAGGMTAWAQQRRGLVADGGAAPKVI